MIGYQIFIIPLSMKMSSLNLIIDDEIIAISTTIHQIIVTIGVIYDIYTIRSTHSTHCSHIIKFDFS